MAEIPIDGKCDARFQRVREAFASNFESGGEVGAALAVTLDGRPVVDLWGGYMESEHVRPWTRDTLVNVFSTTKGLTAVCALRLIERGLLDLDAPVARYWPEFAQAGKDKLPVRWLLSHRGGLPAISKPLQPRDLYDWDTMCAALAEQKPWWEPGTKHGYHALTYGWLVGELVRRITGMSLGTYFRKEVAEPLGLDCHIGLDANHYARTSDIIAGKPDASGQASMLHQIFTSGEGMTARAFNNPPVLGGESRVNTPEWRAAEIPAGNGHCTAHSIARLYGALARGGELDGVRVLKKETIEQACVEQSYGLDAVLMMITTRFGLGFMLSQPGMAVLAFGKSPRAFGHPGAGGSIGFADPDNKIGFGYVRNEMGMSLVTVQGAVSLIEAVYASL